MAGKKGYRLRTIAYTKTFKKDYQRMAASGRYDMTLVNQVGGLLIAHTLVAFVTATGFIGAQRLRTIYVVLGVVAGALSLYIGILFVFGLGTALPDLQQLLFGTDSD